MSNSTTTGAIRFSRTAPRSYTWTDNGTGSHGLVKRMRGDDVWAAREVLDNGMRGPLAFGPSRVKAVHAAQIATLNTQD